jgi:hypothetical protein
MVHIYYHIYAIDGVESIIDEQLTLIQKFFQFPYTLNIGISIADENITSRYIIEKIYGYNKLEYKIKDIRCKGNEFVTLDLIETDKDTFKDEDYVFYFHTKGASKINHAFYNYICDWRNLLQFFNIEKVNNVFKIFEKTDCNTYGINLLSKIYNEKPTQMYGGNFWWAKAKYIKTINTKKSDKFIRVDAEINYIQNGIDWNPFNAFNSNVNHYYEPYPKNNYAK